MKIVEHRYKLMAVSVVVILAGVVSMLFHMVSGNGAFNMDVDFSGGTSLTFDLREDFEQQEALDIVMRVTGQSSPKVQKVIGTTQLSVLTQYLDQEMRMDLMEQLGQRFPDAIMLSFSEISPTVSGEMRNKALMAVACSCLCMLIYISIRFRDSRAGLSSIIALLHDAGIILSIYAIFRLPFNNSLIAAILTILGYSINATIVIFDRIRENKRQLHNAHTADMVNNSVKQTLTRSIYTTLTTLMVILCVYIFGVKSVKEFALPIILGIFCGTYSSICIAPSVWFMLMQRKDEKTQG